MRRIQTDMIAVYKREIKAYLNNVYGFLFAAVLLVVMGAMMFIINLNYGLADLAYAWSGGYCEYVLMLMVPILCMRSMADDRKNGTDMLYRALPLKPLTVILGKYLALLTVFAVPMVIIALYPLLLSTFGKVNFAWAYTTILMYFFLGAALLALCLFISSLTKFKSVAAVTGMATCVVLYFAPTLISYLPYSAPASFICFGVVALIGIAIAWFSTKNVAATCITAAAAALVLCVSYLLDMVLKWGLYEGLFPFIAFQFSPFYQYEWVVQSGFVDLYSVVVLLVFAAFFVFLTVRSEHKRRQA